MGQFLTKVWDGLSDLVGGDDEWNILMLGLDNAGKTTLVYKMKLNEVVNTIPTIGFNVETVTPCKGVKFTIWDVGGQETIRRLWRHYYHNCKGLVFVVDSNDPTRFTEARDELNGILNAPEMPPGIPVVILANKQDLPMACRPRELINKLSIESLRNPWHIQACTAISGDGVYEAMDQMSKMLKSAHRT